MKKYAGECDLWTGAVQSSGYGNVQVEGRWWLAHRLAYTRAVGPIPEGLEIDHLCRQRLCVRVDHMEVVSHRENLRRSRGWEDGVCPRGHDVSGPAGWYVRGNRTRCRECANEASRRYRARVRAA